MMNLLASILALCLVAASPVVAQSSEGTPTEQEQAQDSLSILFNSGASSIRPDQQGTLDQAARLFRDGNPIVMIVSGNADTVGAANANLDLSIRRARSVADGLVARGIPIDRLQVMGRGNSELPVPTPDGTPNAENRSVIISWR